jgi:predicted enzyme related to lactoylglutathione lyase
MENNANTLNWFEIPASDIKRAKTFYENIFGIKMETPATMMGMEMVMFPGGQNKVSGAIVKSDMHKPSHDGTLVYLNANPAGMDAVLAKIPNAGGSVVMHKTMINEEIGFMGMFIDSEGNKVALHSQN